MGKKSKSNKGQSTKKNLTYQLDGNATLTSRHCDVRVRDSITKQLDAKGNPIVVVVLDWARKSTDPDARIPATDAVWAYEALHHASKQSGNDISEYSLMISDRFSELGIKPNKSNTEFRLCCTRRFGKPYVLQHPNADVDTKRKATKQPTRDYVYKRNSK